MAVIFVWNEKLYRGSHEPLVSRRLFDAARDVCEQANRPEGHEHQHAFAGLLTCGRCGCALTAEGEEQRCVYYDCTGSFKGNCGNTYIR